MIFPIGTLYADPVRKCVYTLICYEYSEYSQETICAYLFKRTNNNENFNTFWTPSADEQRWIDRDNSRIYLPKEHNVGK